MNNDLLDKDDKYKPISFSRNYFDEPVEVQPYWIKNVYVKNFLGKGDIDLDVLGKPALTAPNGYGKTVLMNLIYNVLHMANGGDPADFDSLIENHMFEEIAVTTVDGNCYAVEVPEGSSRMYHYIKNGSLYIVNDKAMPTRPYEPTNTSPCILPVKRIAIPDLYIYQCLLALDGNPNYDFLAKWYHYLVLGGEMGDELSTADNRYASIPYRNDVTVNDALGMIRRWMGQKYFSHGEIEVLLQLLAMSGGYNVVLIDDAEMGLHPSVQVSYMYLLSSLYKQGIQVLFSTNAPSMFDNTFSYSNDLFDARNKRKE